MSKYDPLSRHLTRSKGAVELSFDDLEEVLGFALPRSARRYPAWWSNSEGSHVQAKAWLGAGYRTEDVNIAQERVRFVPQRGGGFGEMEQSPYKPATGEKPQLKPAVGGKANARHPIWGVWKGLVTLDPDYDYTQPADPDWGKVYED
jgi:hypothetical protein